MRNAGSVDVGIHQADGRAAVLQSIGDRRRDRALADAAFAGADGDDALGREADLADFFRRPVVLRNSYFEFRIGGQFACEERFHFAPRIVPQRPSPGRQPQRDDHSTAVDRDLVDLLHRAMLRPVSGSGKSARTDSIGVSIQGGFQASGRVRLVRVATGVAISTYLSLGRLPRQQGRRPSRRWTGSASRPTALRACAAAYRWATTMQCRSHLARCDEQISTAPAARNAAVTSTR